MTHHLNEYLQWRKLWADVSEFNAGPLAHQEAAGVARDVEDLPCEVVDAGVHNEDRDGAIQGNSLALVRDILHNVA